ncbi:bifunctional adenosylcobinamide kinase/adenosylcobinamide-phosphate guanylyltransferase [Alkalicoccus luteus]|uniref:Adenosylcobinamide kinase n=1 Tax=Alkalicoccus luteus TaxID=1237094 RepID=A0A969PRK3_9BACI|nr:bifunctional adenosylcobinamide kinase/adenosylcobinamide-phosphate guanylyltransferase [Alkalicoccus luteus]NJP39131.1 hypothetical protein [Alkalicoccus luteus]
MHIIIGGAYAGKREHAAGSYPEAEWVKAGSDNLSGSAVTIVDNCEMLLREGRSSEEVLSWLHTLAERTHLVVILEEMGNGIVPAESSDRRLRDENGRLARKLVAAAETVDYAWHGLVDRRKP